MKLQRIIIPLCILAILLSFSMPTVAFASETITEPTTEGNLGVGDSGNVEVEETEEEKTKKWYDYLGELIVTGYGNITTPIVNAVDTIVDLLNQPNDYLNYFNRFFELVEDEKEKFEEQWQNIVNFFVGINSKTTNFILAVWEFPIIKEYSILIVGLIVVGAIFGILKRGV